MDQQRPAESPLFNPGSKADRPTADDNNVTATSGGGDHGETPMMEYAAEAGREAPVEAPAEVSKPAEPPAEAAAEGGAERRLLFGQYAEVARAPANEAEVTSENVLVTSPDAEKGGAEAQADAEAGAAGAETLVVKPVDQSGNISNSAASVRLYSGLPPHGLTDEQISELFDAVQQMKAKSSNQNFFKHGWQCMFTLRAPGATTRGDMCVIDPRDGQKIFSLIGMRRKLGLSEAMEPPRSYPKEKTVRADDDPDAPPAPSLLLEDRTRRNRTVVNYAEKAGDRARPAEHVAAVLTEAGEQGVDLATLAESVHKRMAVNEEGDDGHVPYGVVRQARTPTVPPLRSPDLTQAALVWRAPGAHRHAAQRPRAASAACAARDPARGLGVGAAAASAQHDAGAARAPCPTQLQQHHGSRRRERAPVWPASLVRVGWSWGSGGRGRQSSPVHAAWCTDRA